MVLQESGPDGNISYAQGLGLISESGPGFDYFYQYDGLGSVVGLTDPTAKLAGRYGYDAWGQTDTSIPDTKIGTKDKFHYTGQTLDPGTQLYYLRARYYDPSVGRFLSRDPLAGLARYPLSLNRFLYAVNDPLDLLDPAGLCVFCKPTLLGLARASGGFAEIFSGGALITSTSGAAAVPGAFLIAHGGYTITAGVAEVIAGLANKPIHIPSPAGIVASAFTSDPNKITPAETAESAALAVFAPSSDVPTAVLGLRAVGQIGKVSDLLGKLSVNTALALGGAKR